MSLTAQERFFVQKRRRLTRIWPWAGSTLFVATAGLAAWLFRTAPLLINPWEVISRLKAGQVPQSTLSLMAMMLPVAMLMCLAILCILLALTFVALANERRHIRIIDRLDGGHGSSPRRSIGTRRTRPD